MIRITTILMRMFVLTLLLAVFVSSATAQDTTDGATPLGIAPGAPAGSYELSGFDNVNLFNGDLNFRLPLAKVRGRGEAAYTMMLPIEQKWTVHQYRDPLYEIDKYSPRSNWWNGIKPGYGPGVLQGRGSGSQPGTCQYYFGGSMNNLKVNNTTLTRLTFIVPDGTEYEFRDQLSGGQPRPRTACAPAGAGGASRGTIFVTADGTTATFISDAAINDYYLPGQAITYPSGYLLMRDGLRYRIDNGLVSWMRDRNGNRLTFTYDASQRVTMITDSLNRQMNIAYDYSDASPYGLCDRITFNGFGGAQRIIRVSRTNLSSAFRPDFSLQTYAQLFPELNGSSTSQFNPTVASAVWLPDSDGVTRRYQFFYNNYGELARVVLPTGGAIDYNYAAGATDGVSSGVIFSYSIYRRVIDKRVYPDGVTLTTKMTFSRPESGGTSCCNYTTLSYVVVDQRDSSGTQLLSRDKHYFYGSAIGSLITPTSVAPLATSYPAWTDGREYQTEVMDTNGTTVLRRTTQTWQQRAAVSWWTGTPETAPANDPRIVETSSTLADSNQVTKQTFSYDQHNNRTDVYEYDFGSGAAPPFPLRHTHSTYLAVNPVNGISYADPANGMNYTVSDAHLRGLPTASLVYAVNPSNGAETLAAQSTIAYDEPAYSILNYGSLAGWIDPGTARGNATTTGNWLDTTGTYLQTHAQYDQAGNLRNAWDAKGNQSQVEYSSANAYAFPTLTRTPVPDPSGVYGSTASLVTTRVYDLDTGLVTSTTDANGQTTSFEYNDALDRMTKVNSPDGGRTTRIYVDAHQCGPFVETRTLLDSSGRETDSWQFVDGLGRPYLAQSLDNQDPNNPYLRVDTQYDNMGRAFRVSSPYRSTGCTSALNPSGRWTTSGFDALGRVTSVTTPDSAVVTTSYSGNTVTVTDQAGKTRKSVTDALGRLTQVYEDPNGLNYLTSYTYDVLGNLRRIDQGSQQRFFMYDSLSRLIRTKNLEQAAGSIASNITDSITGNSQWSMAYGYDNNGNLTARVDARDITTTYAYDALNRNTTVRYTDGTKDIDRHYDNPTANKNGLGRFWYSNWDQYNNTRFDTHLAIDQYDSVGRPLNYRQHFLTNGAASPQFNVTRTCDKTGHVLTQTYPSGRTVNYGYDIAGRLNSDSGNLGDGVSRTYSTGVTYSEFGGLQQEQFGTQTPLYHKLHYNVRGQLYDVRLSTLSLQANEFDWNRGCLAFYYGGYGWGQSGPGNNGNMTMQQHWAPGDESLSTYAYQQDSYSYDALNRISTVGEIQGGQWGASGQYFAQVYDYDRWGNRTINQTQTWGAGAPKPNFGVNTANNRLTAPAGYAVDYDYAGNQTNDTYTGQGQRTFDAENRMKQAWANNQWQTYTYDADGRRIKRNVNGVETWQVYGMDGELLAEYASGAAPFLPTTEYGYRGGELLVTITNGDPQRLTRFVTNLYYGALQRDPTSQELTDKVNQLAAAGATSQAQLLTVANQIARSLFTATNYETNSPARSDLQYTADLYYAYLQRGPDDGGLGFWAGQAAGGVTNRTNVCNAFEGSGEFQTLVANLYGTAASDNERTDHFVNNFYRGAYGRDATSTEIQQQRDALNAAAAQSQAAVQSQAETFGRSLFAGQVNDSSISDSQFVTNLYEAFLQRGPDAGGLGWWSGQATVGTGRQNVLGAFATSSAFRDLSGTLYREANWLVSDHLGTPRMIADKSGSLASMKRHDYLPFGEELFSGIGGRTTTQGYTADSVRQKFTLKERDNETGLDWFGPGRYYSSTQGRFTSVDPGGAGAQAVNPQSLNRYTYTLNRPTIAIDPDGLSTIVVTVTVPAGGGNPTASIIFSGKIGENGADAAVGYDGLAAGQGRDRMATYNDTPYGIYSFDGTQGGTAESRLGRGFGTGKIIITGEAGEIIDSGRTLIRLHGGGTPLGDHAYDLDQNLIATQGCVRMHNGDVNRLIGNIGTAGTNQDPLDRVFIGTATTLTTTANQTDRNGNYVNPDLRLAMGMYSNEQQRQGLITADANRRAEVQRQREEQQRQRQERQRQRQQRRHPENQ